MRNRAKRKPYYEFNLAEMWYSRNCCNKAPVYDNRLSAIVPTGNVQTVRNDITLYFHNKAYTKRKYKIKPYSKITDNSRVVIT